MTNYPDVFAALAAPFDRSEVKSRDATRGGRQVEYITARTAMNRLDNVLGPENWWDAYRPGGDNSVICRLTVRLPDGTELAKEDAGGAAGMADAGDDDKSALSDAFKRAAVKFGVGRYLYRDGVPTYCLGRVEAPEAPPEGATISIDRPAEKTPQRGRDRGPWQGAENAAGRGSEPPAPRTGKALFAWAREQDKRQIGLMKTLTSWAAERGIRGRFVDLTPDQVAAVYAEGRRLLQQGAAS
jgi:hypothetical protein